jgi:polysaccharide export outer membrane protein
MLAAFALGALAGCASPSSVQPTVRGQAPDLAAPIVAEQPVFGTARVEAPTAFATGAPAAREPERSVQWAEARAAVDGPATPGATPVSWRPFTRSAPTGPELVTPGTATLPQQGPVMMNVNQGSGVTLLPQPADPVPGPEHGPAPRVVVGGHPPGPDVVLGPPVPRVPTELRKMSLPPYTVAPPDILLIESTQNLPNQPVKGQHLVRPDGTINLGIYGASVYVAGMTLDQARIAVAQAIQSRLDPEKVKVKLEDITVDVLAYNSKVYYVITDGGGFGEQVYRIPVTGNETVLDAIAQINGLPAVASKKHIWVARRAPHGDKNNILPVDWCGITQRGDTSTNYQVFPGDRVYVQADRLIATDSFLAKLLAPVERILGVTLLGSSTVNSIRNGNNNTGNTGR